MKGNQTNLYQEPFEEENNLISEIANNMINSPTFSYSTQLLKETVDNTNKKIKDREINIIDDYINIFPLSITLLVMIVILILIYISFF
tara:strand:+ start:2419 stop:2682 length:264 start_codon:yes stop_codon:yes gene_type:complete